MYLCQFHIVYYQLNLAPKNQLIVINSKEVRRKHALYQQAFSFSAVDTAVFTIHASRLLWHSRASRPRTPAIPHARARTHITAFRVHVSLLHSFAGTSSSCAVCGLRDLMGSCLFYILENHQKGDMNRIINNLIIWWISDLNN